MTNWRDTLDALAVREPAALLPATFVALGYTFSSSSFFLFLFLEHFMFGRHNFPEPRLEERERCGRTEGFSDVL